MIHNNYISASTNNTYLRTVVNLGKSTKQNNFNIYGKINNNSVTDSFIKSDQIAFKGDFTKLGKNLLERTDSQLGGRGKRFIGEAIDSVRNSARKFKKGKDDLPIAKKPVTADMSKEQDAILAKEAERQLVQQRIKETEDQLRSAGVRNTGDSDYYDSDGRMSQWGWDAMNKAKYHHDPSFEGAGGKHDVLDHVSNTVSTKAKVLDTVTNVAEKKGWLAELIGDILDLF